MNKDLIQNNIIDDELLGEVTGGTSKVKSLVQKGKKPKPTTTLMSGTPASASSLVYKPEEAKEIKSNKPTFC